MENSKNNIGLDSNIHRASNRKSILTEIVRQNYNAIRPHTPLLDPLVDIVTSYLTLDPRIADVLHRLSQYTENDSNYKLTHRVKHRDDPFGSDVAEITIERLEKGVWSYQYELHFVVRMHRLDRHNGETCVSYADGLRLNGSIRECPGSDGETVRLNAHEAIFNMNAFNDMREIAIAMLYRMIEN